jgi:hypothetical protein
MWLFVCLSITWLPYANYGPNDHVITITVMIRADTNRVLQPGQGHIESSSDLNSFPNPIRQLVTS